MCRHGSQASEEIASAIGKLATLPNLEFEETDAKEHTKIVGQPLARETLARVVNLSNWVSTKQSWMVPNRYPGYLLARNPRLTTQ